MSLRGTGEPGEQAAALIWRVRKDPDTLERLDKITRQAKQRPARFEYRFMKACGEQLAAIAKLVETYVESGRAAGKVVVEAFREIPRSVEPEWNHWPMGHNRDRCK